MRRNAMLLPLLVLVACRGGADLDVSPDSPDAAPAGDADASPNEAGASDAGTADADAGPPCALTPATQLACFGSATFREGVSVDSDRCAGSDLDAFFADAGLSCYRPSALAPTARVWCCLGIDPCASRAGECADAGVALGDGGIAVSTACPVDAGRRASCQQEGDDVLCCP